MSPGCGGAAAGPGAPRGGAADGPPLPCSHAGMSRSVAVVAAYLMKTQGLGWEEALAAVRAAKPDAQ